MEQDTAASLQPLEIFPKTALCSLAGWSGRWQGLGEAGTTDKSLSPSKGSSFHAATAAERPLANTQGSRMPQGTGGGCCSASGDCLGGQQPLPPSLRARVTPPKPSPLETWRSWSVGWCSAALATGAGLWTQRYPSTPSAALSPTARAEWRVSQVCIRRGMCGTRRAPLVGWGLWGGKLHSPSPRALIQGGRTPQSESGN